MARSPSPRLRRLLVAAIAAALALAMAPAPSTASAASTAGSWADAAEATIHPGVQMVTDGAQCTANFIFEQQTTNGRELYIGYAAHCAAQGESTQTNGCEVGSLPIDTPVQIDGATKAGTLAYSSWGEMVARNETNANACAYNDFALVRIDPADHGLVNPSVPVIGGPTALGGATSFGESVYSYGNSSLRLGIELLSPKTGTSLGTSGDGWTHSVYTATPGVPGDSGSGFLDSDGEGFGVLSTLALAPLAGSNGVSDLRKALAYANAGSHDFTLAPGTEPFVGYP
jgi:hypothetical protein